MNYFYYKIKSPEVIALLEGNQQKRREGLKKAFEFADKYGFQIGSRNDGIYEDIYINAAEVPDNLKQYFKPTKRGYWIAKQNSKVAREFGEKIKALKIKLDSPFPLIEKETGYSAGIVFDVSTHAAGTPVVLPVLPDYFLRVPSLSDKPPFASCENYEAVKEWQVQKAIDEHYSGKEEE